MASPDRRDERNLTISNVAGKIVNGGTLNEKIENCPIYISGQSQNASTEPGKPEPQN